MPRIPLTLVFEDRLQKIIAEKVISSCFNRKYFIQTYQDAHGFGWIKQNIKSINRASRNSTYLVIIDLDRDPCPVRKIQDWLECEKNPNLLLRIAVNEIESWLVADTKNFSKFLHLRESRLRNDVENIADPKNYIFELARDSGIRQLSGIAPNGTARIGPNYNEKLGKFVNSSWNPRFAMENSNSLRRSMIRLSEYSLD